LFKVSTFSASVVKAGEQIKYLNAQSTTLDKLEASGPTKT